MQLIHTDRDDDILTLARSGRAEDFRRAATLAFRRYFRDLYAHVRARLPEDEATIQDVLQEVALATVEGLGRLREGAALRPWLLQIASHKVCDHLRRTIRARARFEANLGRAALEHVEDTEGSLERLLERAGEAQMAAYLRRAVDTLNPHQKQAVTLVYFEGVPPADAAARLGIRADALAALLYRARKVFLRQLEDDARRDGPETASRSAGEPPAKPLAAGVHK